VVGKKELNLRRKRLGSMLLQYAELAIAHTGASRVWLTVQEATGATEFYTKMHYTCRRQCVKPGEQLWSKQLTL
jgi:GNAT superfamily N-acetyltransferase